MIRRIIYLVFMLCIALPTLAVTPTSKEGRKQMKQIRENIKNQKGSEALKEVESLLKDSAYQWNPPLLQYGVEACRLLYDKENEKFYLKSKPDTTALFTTLYNVFDYTLRTDKAETYQFTQHSGEKDGQTSADVDTQNKKYKYRRQNTEFCARYYRNLAAAPRYFMSKSDWAETKRFTSMVIEATLADMMSSHRSTLLDDRALSENAFQYITACYKLQKYDEIEKYADLVLKDNTNRETALEYLIFAESQVRDSVSYIKHLELGHDQYPSNMFFFSRLIDYYLHNGNNANVLITANETLEYLLENAQELASLCVIDKFGNYGQPSDNDALIGVRETVALPSNDIAQIYEARAIAYHNQGDKKACIDEAKNILTWNPEHPRADFYIGASYFSMAEDVEIPTHINDNNYKAATRERNNLLSLARPYLETYRLNNPNDSETWAPMLYDTYLYLNLGAEFEEVSRYIH